MFSGSRNIAISGGVFTQVSNQNNGLKVLHENVAPGAFHNSAQRYNPPKCHPGTREAVIKDIMEWIQTENRTEHFLWLYGPAGAGKSAIAQTVAELSSSLGLLAASFFFSRTASGRNSTAFFVATLAYQVTISFPEMTELVSLAIDKDPLIFTRSVKVQLETLILQPLSSVCTPQNGEKVRLHPKIVIIDGLDECSTGPIQRHILEALSSSLPQYPVPLIFLIASRPEQAIRNAFNDDRMESCTRRLVLDDHYLPDADIKLFLTSEFEDIKKRHPLRTQLPRSWPSELELEQLVQRSSGQFIYASTVVKFVHSPRHRPIERLNIMLGLSYPGTQSPFSQLDALYMHIFSSTDNIQKILDVFAYVFLVLLRSEDHETPLYYAYAQSQSWTVNSIEKFLEYEPGDLQFILADLHSLLFVPPPESPERDLQIYHASLRDFLMDRSRSGMFFIVARKSLARMAVHCIHHNSTILKFRLNPDNPNEPVHGKFHKLDSHLWLSFLRFMDLCASAEPTPDLLQALASFSFDQVFTFPSVVDIGIEVRPWNAIAIYLPRFIKWLHEECPSPHHKTCLCTRYMASFHGYLIRALSAYPPSDTEWRTILAAFTLDSSCDFDRSSFERVILGPDFPRRSMKWPQGIPDDYATNDRYSDFRSMITPFLVTQTRSGPYCVDKTQYIQLAIKCVDRLHSRSVATPEHTFIDWLADECASSITFAILSRFPRDPTLAEYLRRHIISEDVARSQKPRSAFDAYVRDYESDQPESKSQKHHPESQKLELESKRRRGPFKFLNWIRTKW